MKNRKLEAKDLMIGDWVSYTECEYYRQVSSIDPLMERVGLGYINLDTFPSYDYCDLHDVNPIPLIPETLEKNGIKRKFTCNCYISVVNGKTISVDVPESLKSQSCTLWIGDCFGGTILHIQISYVHEFQRALRCCRLWDLADNFKV